MQSEISIKRIREPLIFGLSLAVWELAKNIAFCGIADGNDDGICQASFGGN
jgi:hypothetical protein